MASDGSFNGGVTTPLPSQTVNVTGGVYQIAQPSLPASVSLGNAHVGGTLSQGLNVTNTLVAAGFQEGLNATVAEAMGAATAAAGSVINLAAGGSNNTGIVVGLNTAVAGAQSGTVTLGLQSNGAGTSGLSTLDLPNSAPITISGGVYNLAVATINNASRFQLRQRAGGQWADHEDDLDHQHGGGGGVLGGAERGVWQVTNSGAGSFSNNGGTISGLLAGLTDASSLQVTLTPSSAGAITAIVQVAADVERDGDR